MSHCRELLRERPKAPHRAIFFLSTGVGRWRGDHPPGDECPKLGSEGWPRPKVVASAQKVMFHGEILREFGVVAR